MHTYVCALGVLRGMCMFFTYYFGFQGGCICSYGCALGCHSGCVCSTSIILCLL